MTKNSVSRWFWGAYSGAGLACALCILIADQLSKSFMLYHLFPSIGCQPFDAILAHRCKVMVTPFMDYVMVWNEGISYGLLKQTSFEGKIALFAIAIIAIIALIIWLSHCVNLLSAISLGMVIGGAAGNAVDRLAYGAVADFVSLHAFGYYWYVFNIADVAIIAGVAGLLYDAIFPNRKKVSNAS